MSVGARVRNIAAALVMIAVAVILFVMKKDGYMVVAAILALSLLVYGVRNILYYFFMARYMVGGRIVFYFGVIILDAGALLVALSNVPPLYIMIYLIVIRAVSGAVDILRALEQKKMGLSAWKAMMISGIIHILVAAACAVFIRSENIAVYIYAAGLIYAAIVRIVSAVRTPNSITIL